MNAPTRLNPAPRLEDFPYRLTDNVRFADLDPNQHVNNAVYATYFETGRVTLVSWCASISISAPNCAGRAALKWGSASRSSVEHP